jgi:hypothetical protein
MKYNIYILYTGEVTVVMNDHGEKQTGNTQFESEVRKAHGVHVSRE